MGNLRQDLPAIARHLLNMSVHLFHVEESLPVVDPVPTALVRE